MALTRAQLQPALDELADVAASLSVLARRLDTLQRCLDPRVCRYCGVAYDADLHHADPAQDDHWPVEPGGTGISSALGRRFVVSGLEPASDAAATHATPERRDERGDP